jgi:hypothetical protein
MLLKDRLQITSQRKYTDEGFLKVPARISRTGIQEYYAVELGLTDREPQDKIRVFRPQEEVFSEDSLNSFASKPVTNNHPPELVNASNSKKYSVGLSDPHVVKDGDFVSVELNVTDEEAIKNIESGKVELSNGYTADIDWTPGISPEGEQYDAIQRNIKGNHIAIVSRGRAGPSCRVADNSPESGEATMAKITIDGVDYEVSDQAAQAVGKLQTRLDDAEKEAEKKDTDMKKEKEDMEKEKENMKKTQDSLQAKLDDATSKIPSSEAIDKMVADRAALIDSVKKVHPEIVVDGKDESTLMKEVIAAKCSSVQLDSVSDDYVKARFDMLVENINSNSQQHLDEAFTKQVTKDSEGNEVDNRPADIIAREKMMADSQNAWKFGGRK